MDDAAGIGDAPDAFQALGHEARLSVLGTLLEHDGPVPFSTLHEASPIEESAGFAYHLRQLTDRYVRTVDREDGDGYVLTSAGRAVARAVAAGTYTESVGFDPVDLPDPCPLCGAEALRATCTDSRLGIDCRECGHPVLSLPFPPGGLRGREPEEVPAAFDAHHRHRLAMLREGVCPECAGPVDAAVDPVAPPGSSERDDPDADGAERVQATFACEACGYEARSPVALTLLTHPAVVAPFEDHGVDLRDRPIWNVGDEFRETVLSTDPLAVAVSVRVGTELVELFVDGRCRVVDHRRRPDDDGDGADPTTGDSPDGGATDVPAADATAGAGATEADGPVGADAGGVAESGGAVEDAGTTADDSGEETGAGTA